MIYSRYINTRLLDLAEQDKRAYKETRRRGDAQTGGSVKDRHWEFFRALGVFQDSRALFTTSTLPLLSHHPPIFYLALRFYSPDIENGKKAFAFRNFPGEIRCTEFSL
jgi:hypothetical protein